MVHNQNTRDSHEDFCHKSDIFKKDMETFYKNQFWQHLLMNVLLDEQEWCSKQGSTVVASLPRLRMPEMPTPSSQHTVRATGVPGNVSSNCQSPSLCQSTLTQLARSPPPVAAATSKRKNRTSTLDAESDNYTDSLLEDPNYKDENPASQKRPNKFPGTSFEDSVMESVQKSRRKLQSVTIFLCFITIFFAISNKKERSW